MSEVKPRTARDGRATLTASDAVQPIVEGVQRLEASLDRMEQQIEDARRTQAEKKLHALFDGVTERIYAKTYRSPKDLEAGRLHEKITGRRRPRTFAERMGVWRSE